MPMFAWPTPDGAPTSACLVDIADAYAAAERSSTAKPWLPPMIVISE
jgi:hypothetical protein